MGVNYFSTFGQNIHYGNTYKKMSHIFIWNMPFREPQKTTTTKKGILFLLKKNCYAELDISGLPNAERMATKKWALQNAKI